jgi:hypothetical protein
MAVLFDGLSLPDAGQVSLEADHRILYGYYFNTLAAINLLLIGS